MEYHDGTPDLGGISWSGGNGGIGYYMRPAFYPCRINGYRLMIASDPMANGCYLKIFDDDGPNGSPGTMLDSVYASPSSYVVGANSLIPTAGTAINIPSGGFYVLWVMPPGGSVALARDATPPISNRSYEYLGGTWAPCRFRFTEDYFLGVSVTWANFEDVSAQRILSPTANSLLRTPTPVQVRVQNMGSNVNSQPIQLGYKFSVEPAVLYQVPASSIFSGDSLTHQFSTPMASGTLRSGTLSYWVNMSGDMFAGNDTLRINVTYQPSVGFSEIDDRATSWNIFPNPAQDHAFILGLNELALPMEWEIRDATGRKFSADLMVESENRMRIILSGMPSGFYHLMPAHHSLGYESGFFRPLPLLIRR
ncbi:MAG: T9SS C-terminal target domain-containing protein [Sphingobacteriia bacterium]|nr:T9SS C-terminal target domain-containing protein [Sphingobacteriia bacterium]